MKTVKNWSLLKIAVLVPAVALLMYPLMVYLSPSPAFGWGFRGRMTGGGSVHCTTDFQCIESGTFTTDGRVTHGFEVHCAPEDLPNNLEINDHIGGNMFHLESLDSATCFDDPAIDPTPPGAGFDTYIGVGTGRWNGASGYTAVWKFTDAGEPGVNDTWCLQIKSPTGVVVLQFGDFTNPSLPTSCPPLTFGNHQAHKNP